jgi:hypothetical protein
MSSASSLRSEVAPVRWSATPPGTAWAVQWPARSGAPPARAVTPLRPAGTGRASTRRSRCAASAPRAAPGSARPLAFAYAHVSSSGSAPGVASGGPHGPPLRETVGSPRGSGRLSSPRFIQRGKRPLGAGCLPRTPPGSALRLGAALRAERRPLRRGRSCARALKLRSLRSLRVALLLTAYASRRRLRSFVAPSSSRAAPAAARPVALA